MILRLPNKYYNFLKYLTMIGLPAASSLYFGLAQIWAFPYAEEIVGTIALLTAFLGTLLGISTKNYNAEQDYLRKVANEEFSNRE